MNQFQMSPQELAEALKGQSPPRLVDVRGPEEQAVVKLESAVPLTEKLAQEMVDGWEPDTPIVFYCHHGIRSLDAASYFSDKGFTNVKSLSGGIDAWAVKIDPSLPRY